MSFGTVTVEPSDVFTFVASVLAVWGTWAAAKSKIKGDKEAQLPENWKNLTAEMRVFFNEQISELKDDQRFHLGYIEWLTEQWRVTELWAAEHGHELPGPKFMTLDEYRHSRQ